MYCKLPGSWVRLARAAAVVDAGGAERHAGDELDAGDGKVGEGCDGDSPLVPRFPFDLFSFSLLRPRRAFVDDCGVCCVVVAPAPMPTPTPSATSGRDGVPASFA